MNEVILTSLLRIRDNTSVNNRLNLLKQLYIATKWNLIKEFLFFKKDNNAPTNNLLNQLLNICKLYKYIIYKIVLQKNENLYIHIYEPWILHLPLLFLSYFGVLNVVCEHVDYYNIKKPELSLIYLYKLQQRLMQLLSVKLCSKNIFISNSLKFKYVLKNKILILPGIVDITLYEKLRTKILVRDEDVINIGYTGSLSPDQGFNFLCSQISMVRKYYNSFKLHIAGGHSSVTAKQILNIIDDYGLSEITEYHGVITKEEVVKLQINCHILIIPKLKNDHNYFGFPTKLAEYLASGSLAIVPPIPVIQEYCSSNENCIIYNDTARNSLSEAIIEILNNKNKINFIAPKGVELAASVFNYKNYVTKLKEYVEG